jgi:hypothetical protein
MVDVALIESLIETLKTPDALIVNIGLRLKR